MGRARMGLVGAGGPGQSGLWVGADLFGERSLLKVVAQATQTVGIKIYIVCGRRSPLCHKEPSWSCSLRRQGVARHGAGAVRLPRGRGAWPSGLWGGGAPFGERYLPKVVA